MAINISSVLLAALGLMSLGLAAAKPTEATNGAQVTPIPMIFRIVCGSTSKGWGQDCDGRTQYCDLTGPVVKCGSCKRICKLGQSTSQCQSSCKMFLEFAQETARELAWDRKLDLMGTRSENERKEIKDKLDKLTSNDIGLIAGMAVMGLFLIVFLALLINLARNTKGMRTHMEMRMENPLGQPMDGKPKAEPESGFNTGANTPERPRRDTENPAEDDTEIPAGQATEPLLGNATQPPVGNAPETRAEAETTQNLLAHPSDAPSGEQVSP